MEVLFYLLLGLIAGAASGLLGIGGGIILIPAFLAIFRSTQISQIIAMHLAIGTSLATMMAASLTAIASLFGTTLGVSLAHRLPPDKLVKVFALVLVVVGAKMVL